MRKSTMEPGQKSFSGRGLARLFGLAALLALGLAGCAGSAKGGGQPAPPDPETAGQAAAAAPVVPGSTKKFEEAGELDKLLDAKPIALAAVKPASQAGPATVAKTPDPVLKGKGNFRIQVGAESDLDAAQLKKAEYEKMLGGPVDVTFDAPFYKLRWGYFDSKQDAEDKLLELSDFKIQGFVIKQ